MISDSPPSCTSRVTLFASCETCIHGNCGYFFSGSKRGSGYETNLYIVSFPGSKRGSGYETNLYIVSFPGSKRGSGYETNLHIVSFPGSKGGSGYETNLYLGAVCICLGGCSS